ncbi:MAG TPA: hypothetical protein VKT75_16555 [Acidobacteriaceae bacterium]|nr:hypothetical protein [Acidobacteriaceae bacterium]
MRWQRLMTVHLLAAGMVAVASGAAWAQQAAPVKLDPSTMAKRGSVDSRYLSFNVEMVEVTGGRFWKPYSSTATEAPPPASSGNGQQQVGMDPNRFQYRPPIDLANPRLRRLAQALSPSYVRVSGSWANSTYFQDDDRPALQQPPAGFRGVLTRAEWKGVIDFSNALGSPIVTSVATSQGTRDASGAWTPAQAQAVFDFTKSSGGKIAASEYMNEPTFATIAGAPAGYSAADFGRDAKLFAAFLRKELPGAIYLGPGSVGEGISLGPPGSGMPQLIATSDMMQATGPIFDAFSYHFYGTRSHRCGGTMTAEQALSAEWLDRTDTVEAFYAKLRDQYLPGKPMWLTETGEAACGGDPFAAQFADTFRFLNQLGTLAQRGVQVVMRNTLASSDYGLLDEHTFEPRPDYWAAVLWKRTMGTVVLDPGQSGDPNVRIYAHCMKGFTGGVTVLALNTDRASTKTIQIPAAANRFTLSAASLTSTQVRLNGRVLQISSDGSLPEPKLGGEVVTAGAVSLPPASITFLTIPSARNESCNAAD